MRLWPGGAKEERRGDHTTRMLFASDLHAGETVWRKLLNAAAMMKVDALVVGGDITGKMVVPLVGGPDGKYEYSLAGREREAKGQQLEEVIKSIRNMGYYPYITTPSEVEELRRCKGRLDEVFVECMKETLHRWFGLIREKLPEGTKVLVLPGNDDRMEIDEVMKSHKDVIYSEGRVVKVSGPYEVVSCGWTNPTPWNSPREEDEAALKERLRGCIRDVGDVSNAIFNFHAPPYQTRIDEAPLIDVEFRPVIRAGRVVMAPVGSKSVRELIEGYQPLLGLHGHVHESPGMVKIGRTFCVNPGSEYSEGIMKAYLIDLEEGGVKRLQRIEG